MKIKIVIFTLLTFLISSNILFAETIKEPGICELKGNPNKDINVTAEIDKKTKKVVHIIVELDENNVLTLEPTKNMFVFGKIEGDTYIVFSMLKELLQKVDSKTKKVIESYTITNCRDK